MAHFQLIEITPEEFKTAILEGVRKELGEIKKDFQPKKPTEYLTREETAGLLKINLSTLFNWTKKGKLNAYGIGSRVYYKREEVEKALVKIN